MIPTTEPYVPATMRNVPKTIRVTLQTDPSIQDLVFFCPLPFPQLSCNHIAPIGWMHITGPSKAPMRDTKESKTGIVLAMIQAITVTPKVHANQVIQWVGVLLLRCLDPRSIWTKMNLDGILSTISLVKLGP